MINRVVRLTSATAGMGGLVYIMATTKYNFSATIPLVSSFLALSVFFALVRFTKITLLAKELFIVAALLFALATFSFPNHLPFEEWFENISFVAFALSFVLMWITIILQYFRGPDINKYIPLIALIAGLCVLIFLAIFVHISMLEISQWDWS